MTDLVLINLLVQEMYLVFVWGVFMLLLLQICLLAFCFALSYLKNI